MKAKTMQPNYLYTFMLEYNGGTFISQVWSPSVEKAKIVWCNDLSFQVIGASVCERAKFLESVADELPTPVCGLVNTWCLAPALGDMTALVHVVKTHEEGE